MPSVVTLAVDGCIENAIQILQSLRRHLGEPMVEWFMIDFEAGWHRRINGRAARGNLEFYVLVPLLKGESETVDLQIRLVSENRLTRTHRKKYAKSMDNSLTLGTATKTTR